ncbi:MAG: NADH-quinone oxidoreductase subunit L [Gemmataceae bacterium]|nr:NADH-quinone oxidoreductase subunit L [Gemmataceae bacterium]
MFDATFLMWLIPLLPLLASVTIAAVGRRWFPDKCHIPCIAGAVGACMAAILVFVAVAAGDEAPIVTGQNTPWISAGHVTANFSLRADGLSAVMLVMVTFIGSLIAIYSAGYMHGDPGYPRFFAAVSLFLFFMVGLVLANNFVLLYACWEGVGLCSYLLIGFWFAKPSAAAAARKAFLVTRLGDIGLFIGILILWAHSPGHSLEYDDVFRDPRHFHFGGMLFWACLCLFIGAAGKSAQFPLHVWLPDAMEGPSPVSALIHAATMVTAGVYLVARCMPLFGAEPAAQLIVACVGGFTALLAALIAVTQTDLKRVLAYSTLSQLGYMFLALGSGIGEHKLAGLAVTAAIFHLFTHAFFKALLFLGAGSVMHSMGNVIDMREFGGLRKVLPITHWTFLCGALALAGFPLLSGFWSKDEILTTTFEAWQQSAGPVGGLYGLLFFSALFTAGLTAFYTGRAYFKTFWGPEKLPPEAGHHPHDAPPLMAWPLRILAVGALGVGIVLGPFHLFAHFLDATWIKRAFGLLAEEHHANMPLMAASSVIAVVGIGLAYWMYVKQPEVAEQMSRRLATLFELSHAKFYFDELYELAIVKPMTILAHVCRIIDAYLLDGLVDLLGQAPALMGFLVRPVQNGLVQYYALLMTLGLAGFVLSILLR